MLGVIARSPRRRQKIAVARFLLEVLDAPRGPECLHFLLWKFVVGHAYRPLKLKSCAPKSSQNFYYLDPVIPSELKKSIDNILSLKMALDDKFERNIIGRHTVYGGII